MNLPAFERLVRAHIPRGVPEEWRSVQDYTLKDLKDAAKHAVADEKGSRVQPSHGCPHSGAA